jgi:hypothetical protein
MIVSVHYRIFDDHLLPSFYTAGCGATMQLVVQMIPYWKAAEWNLALAYTSIIFHEVSIPKADSSIQASIINKAVVGTMTHRSIACQALTATSGTPHRYRMLYNKLHDKVAKMYLCTIIFTYKK